MTAMAATHACPGGCHRQLPSGHFACRWCWDRLPPTLRHAITGTHGRDPDAHVEAMLAALAWYREEPVERTAVPADPPWPRVVEGECSWCGDPESVQEGGVREHHRIEVVGGRYDDEPETNDEREVERRVLDVVRDLFAVLDAHGYQRTSDDAALGRAVVAVWQLVDEYEGPTESGTVTTEPVKGPAMPELDLLPGASAAEAEQWEPPLDPRPGAAPAAAGPPHHQAHDICGRCGCSTKLRKVRLLRRST